MQPTSVMRFLTAVRDGREKVGHTYGWVQEKAPDGLRASMAPWMEAEAWSLYREWARGVEVRVKFGRKGVGNGHEMRRRRLLMWMFFAVEFRSQDDYVRQQFQLSVGRLSLMELMRFVGLRMPHFYYRWAFDVLPLSSKQFGPESFRHLESSPDHRREFRSMAVEKQNLLAVKKVMES